MGEAFKMGDKIVCIRGFEVDGRYFNEGEEVYVAGYRCVEVNKIKHHEWGSSEHPKLSTGRYWDIRGKLNENYFELAKPKQKFYLDI